MELQKQIISQKLRKLNFIPPVMQFYTERKLHIHFFFHIQVTKASIKSECYTKDWLEDFPSNSKKGYGNIFCVHLSKEKSMLVNQEYYLLKGSRLCQDKISCQAVQGKLKHQEAPKPCTPSGTRYQMHLTDLCVHVWLGVSCSSLHVYNVCVALRSARGFNALAVMTGRQKGSIH